MPPRDRDEPSGGATGRQRYGVLLAALLVVFGLQGAVSGSAAVEVIVTGLLGATLLLALWAAGVRPRLIRTTSVVAVTLFVVGVVNTVGGGAGATGTKLASLLLVALAPPAVAIGVVRGLQRHGAVTVEAVFGVLSLYLLLGMLFAFLYATIDALGGDPFFAGGEAMNASRSLYFSFTTLTTVGYGDLTARTDAGHTLSMFEALVGQIYLVTVVSAIVANVRRREPAGPA